MTQSNGAAAQDNAEIDRIIQEIENMERQMDQAEQGSSPAALPTSAEAVSQVSPAPTPVSSPAPALAAAPTWSEQPEAAAEEATPGPALKRLLDAENEQDNVIPFKEPEPLGTSLDTDSGEGALSLKVGGSTTIHLEFDRGGTRVSLRCDQDALTITAGGGAEFRIPLHKRAA